MPLIELLDQQTIDKIAAGEVVDRPSSVVKELVENAIDAKSTAVTVEIRGGGIDLIRITDNGCGIEKEQIPIAFFRHSTSKIRKVTDLLTISSLGFRGEALSSIAAVSQVELITKPIASLVGCRYLIEGGLEKSLEEIGAPNGTTILVKNLFYNTPARKKFLRTPQTEAGYISALMERLALSHPDISFKFITNGQTKLHTSGNGKLKDVIYGIYGRDITSNLLPVDLDLTEFSLTGFIGKPIICRGNRNYENYFINGRYITSKLISKSIEDAYKGFLMQHKYPFTALHFTIEGNRIDVNVHPGKMEMRFSQPEGIYEHLTDALRSVLSAQELIPRVSMTDQRKSQSDRKEKKEKVPEPFEAKRLEAIRQAVKKDSPYERKYPQHASSLSQDTRQKPAADQNSYSRNLLLAEGSSVYKKETKKEDLLRADQEVRSALTSATDEKEKSALTHHAEQEVRSALTHDAGLERKAAVSQQSKETEADTKPLQASEADKKPLQASEADTEPLQASEADTKPLQANEADTKPLQESEAGTGQPLLAEDKHGQMEFTRFLQQDARPYYKIIGQVFETYWLIELKDALYIIDQHAAHEKVLFERTMKSFKDRSFYAQMVSPPIILNLSMQEENLLLKYLPQFEKLGFEIEDFGENAYAIRALPADLYGLNGREVFLDLIDSLQDLKEKEAPDVILEKVASMSCKAAVKGNQKLSTAEMKSLLDELLLLDNPYFCPHGRPVIVSMTRTEMDKKFKRIV